MTAGRGTTPLPGLWTRTRTDVAAASRQLLATLRAPALVEIEDVGR
ncbi:hypothetical protein ND748_01395 [Frankia sp. AiPs1]|nr:hypothetical protein [Frankia sp. AiPs1]